MQSQELSLNFRYDKSVDYSAFPPIPDGPFPPLFEFVSENWAISKGGYLNENNVAIIDGHTGMQRTFEDYATSTVNMSTCLVHEFGIEENDTVALYCPNHVDYAPITLSVALAGAKLTPINPLCTVQELPVILQRSHATILIAHAKTLLVALEAVKECPRVQHVIVVTDENVDADVPYGVIDLNYLRQFESDDSLTSTPHAVHRSTSHHPVILPYSSGTTGMPKGVCLTHSNIVANLLQFDQVESIGFPPDHKLISPLPFFHIYAFTVSMLFPAWKGHTVITSSGRFDLLEFCELIEAHRPRRAHLVPPILLGLAKHPSVDNYDLSSLGMIISAAAPLSSETEKAVMDRLPRTKVKQGWGMSELSPIGAMNSDFASKSGSVGPVVSSTIAKVVDEHGNSLPPHQSGELYIKGPQVMMGYLNDPDKTAECLTETGWLRTGDLAHYDEDGYLFITDRVKELIKVRGYPVAPAELEAVLLKHPAVADAAVVSILDEESGELPRAFVTLKADKKISDKELYEFVKDQVAPYKRLDGGITFVDEIPKSASGKILRRILREQVRREQK